MLVVTNLLGKVGLPLKLRVTGAARCFQDRFQEEITMGRIIWVIAALVVLAGCNTFQGIGEDVSAGGEVISEAAS